MSKVNRKVNQMLRLRHLGGARAVRSLLVAGALVLALGARSASASTLNILLSNGKEGSDCAYALKYVFLLLGYSNGDWAAVAPWLTADVQGSFSCSVDEETTGIGGSGAGQGMVAGGGGGIGSANFPTGFSATNDFGFDESVFPPLNSLDGQVGDEDPDTGAFDIHGNNPPTDFFDDLFKYGGDESLMNESLVQSFRFTPTTNVIDPIPTPEPGSLLLLGTGLASSLWRFRFNRAKSARGQSTNKQ